MKAVKKFTEIFATECSNFALKALPTGGIFLVGGVTMGITDYIIKE
jgi:glucokinase